MLQDGAVTPLSFPEASDAVGSVSYATDLPAVKGLRSKDSPLLSLRPSLPLLWWN